MRLVLALIAGALLTTPHFPPPILEQVLETGRLRVVTRNAPTAWYIGSDGPTGPEYDLVRGFSEDLGVELDMVPMDSFSELVPSVAQGDAHMAAGALSITEPRLALVRFSQPYQQVEQHLIYRRGTGRPQSLVEVQNREIVVVAGSSHADTMR
ncbi:MAG: transporter substrate-binding domain-containing protein, partial [Pseudomonadota bacterium]